MNESRFRSLCSRCLGDMTDTAAESIYAELSRRYAQPHRYYHTGEHIDRCLEQLDLARSLMDDPDAVEMAVWFHDAVYDPHAPDNELKSAELFLELVGDRADSDFGRDVYDFILITTHRGLPGRRDEEFVADIDMSGFGAPWEIFKRDADAIREEYAHLSNNEFFSGQVKFLETLLGRPRFYYSAFFRARYEAAARQNMGRLVRELQAQGYETGSV